MGASGWALLGRQAIELDSGSMESKQMMTTTNKTSRITTVILWVGLTLALLAALPFPAHAQAGIAKPVSIADIAGNSAAQQISATSVSARWVLIVALAANAAAIRVGDSSVSASRGAQVAAGGGLFLPALPQNSNSSQQNLYDLSAIYFYGTSSESVSIIYGK